MGEHELWVNTRFRGQDADEFAAVKEWLGIKTNSDVMRYLVRKQAHEMRGEGVEYDVEIANA